MKTNIFFACLFVSGLISAQELTNKKGSEYKFTVVKNIEGTPVQNQNITGTCWSFSSLSFLESEIIRLGKGKEFNLSEMFQAVSRLLWDIVSRIIESDYCTNAIL